MTGLPHSGWYSLDASVEEWIKKSVVYLHNGVLLSHQKQWLYEIPRKMDAYREYHTEWDNPVTEEQT